MSLTLYFTCAVCQSDQNCVQVTGTEPTEGSILTLECKRCGRYRIQHGTGLRAKAIEERVRPLAAGWIRDQNSAGLTPELTVELIARFPKLNMPMLMERAVTLLRAVIRQHDLPQEKISKASIEGDANYQGLTYCQHPYDVRRLLGILDHLAYTQDNSQGTHIQITPLGFISAEEAARKVTESVQAFVVMSFDAEMDAAYSNGFDVAVRKAGFSPLRLDRKDYVGGISDQILAEIRQSRFVIADYTKHSNGAYFEAGFALGLEKTIIPTCAATDEAALHFDIQHLNTLIWSSPSDLASKLEARILTVIGAGPLKSLDSGGPSRQ